MSRIHLRLSLVRPTAGDPARTYQRWQAFEDELLELDGLIIARTVEQIDIAIPPDRELEARNLVARFNDPHVVTVPRLVMPRVRAPGAAS